MKKSLALFLLPLATGVAAALPQTAPPPSPSAAVNSQTPTDGERFKMG